jgi:hypothetical protein
MKWKDILEESVTGGDTWDKFVEVSQKLAIKHMEAIVSEEGIECAKEAIHACDNKKEDNKQCEMCIFCGDLQEEGFDINLYNHEQKSVKTHKNICTSCVQIVACFMLVGNAKIWVKQLTAIHIDYYQNGNKKPVKVNEDLIQSIRTDKHLLQMETVYNNAVEALTLFSFV